MKKYTKAVTLKSAPPLKSKAPALFVSPSAWMVWEKCALSLQAVKSPLVLERDEYAKKGTELHKAVEQELKGEKVALESDDTAIVRFVVETVRQELEGHTNFALEYGVSAKRGNVTFFGKPDCKTVIDDKVVVIDYKMGWREVEAEGNSQLKLYAHMEAASNKKIKSWKGIIINARFNSVSYTGGEIDNYYLANTAKDIRTRTAKNSLQPVITVPIASGFQSVQKSGRKS
jgi:hypothetical protein